MHRLGILIPIAHLIYAVFLLTAYVEGANVWLHWQNTLLIGASALLLLILPFGGIVFSVIAFGGMRDGWGWPIWQAFLVAFPFIGLSILLRLMGGIFAAFDRNRS